MSDLIREVYYTIKKVAEILGVSSGTVRNLIKRGNLVPVRISNRVVRISQSELDNDIRVARGDSRKR
jgi:excisionase family DNA binding protein